MITRPKTHREIKSIRQSGKILASILDILVKTVQPGLTTKYLSDIASKELKALGGQPSFLGYQGFPDVLCVSINDEVVHGIPSNARKICEGDIVGLDFGVTYEGMITDAARSVIAGKAKDKSHIELVNRTEQSLMEGISVVRDSIRTGDIGSAIQTYLSQYKYGIVRDLVGHGVGHNLHEEPNIPNYGRAHTGPWLRKNMTIAIEPMVTLGKESVKVAQDGWTILTSDGSLAAHFEHTVLITDNSSEILTEYKNS